jgi:hypothetical protein
MMTFPSATHSILLSVHCPMNVPLVMGHCLQEEILLTFCSAFCVPDRSLSSTVQYFGTDRSIFSAHAKMPPVRFLACLKPD